MQRINVQAGVSIVVFACIALVTLGCGSGSLSEAPGPTPTDNHTYATSASTLAVQASSTTIVAQPGQYGLHSTGDHGVIGVGAAYEGVVGVGAPGSAGGWFRSGITTTATDPQTAIWADGLIRFNNTPAPAPNVPIANAVTPSNVAKAWAVFSTRGAGEYNVDVLAGSNVGGMTVEADSIVLWLAAGTGGKCAAITAGINEPLLCRTACDGAVAFVRCHKIMPNGTLSSYNFGGESPTAMSIVVFGAQ